MDSPTVSTGSESRIDLERDDSPMAKLCIYFVDLIAFVQNSDGSYWVLMPDARRPSTASDGSQIDAHHPVVLFEIPDRGDSDWPRIHQLLHLEDPVSKHQAWLLERQELRIRISSPAGVQAPGTSSVGLPTQSDNIHFTWVPDLAAMGIDAKVHPDCLVSLPARPGESPPSPKIVSRLRLESGTLATFQFVRAKENHVLPPAPKIPKLEFRPLGGGSPIGQERACADVAVIDIPLVVPEVVIEAIDMDNDGAVLRSIPLAPAPGAGDVINLLLGNLSPDPETPPPPAGVHFERYYDLLETPPAQRPVPQLVAGFSADSTTYTEPAGINSDFPIFIITALQVDFSGLNPPICSIVKLQ